MRIRTIEDVVRWRLCVGCGACAYVSDGAVRMVNVPDQGHRPVVVDRTKGVEAGICMQVCPAVGTTFPSTRGTALSGASMSAGTGPVLEVWEGHSTDAAIRLAGASGGALSALAAYGVEAGGMHGTLQVAQDPANPLQNTTLLTRSRAELLRHTGSRYAPASVCDGLHLVEQAPAPCVVIGQPSEIAAIAQARKLRPALDAKIGVTMSFFCAGSPSQQGTLALLKKRGIDPTEVETLRYRGRGWPGYFAVWLRGQSKPALEMTYDESWGFLQSFRPWGVHIWPDGSGEFADITCGDPWYRKVQPGEAGSSLIIARTETGRRFVEAAAKAGFLEIKPADLEKVVQSQKNLLRKKGAIGGRIFAMRVMGLPAPRHRGCDLFRMWLRISLRDKAKSTLGTIRRIWQRKYRTPLPPPTVGP